MAETLIQVYRIAIYESDGESLGDLVGYKSDDGDITEDKNLIQYYSSEKAAEENVDNSDELEVGMREVVESVMMSLTEFMTIH